jgi:hypothetical protein
VPGRFPANIRAVELDSQVTWLYYASIFDSWEKKVLFFFFQLVNLSVGEESLLD